MAGQRIALVHKDEKLYGCCHLWIW